MKDKFATFPKLNVRRCSRIIVGENEDNNNRSNEIPTKSKGAEFILNSSLPCQEIDISEQNVCIVLPTCCFPRKSHLPKKKKPTTKFQFYEFSFFNIHNAFSVHTDVSLMFCY